MTTGWTINGVNLKQRIERKGRAATDYVRCWPLGITVVALALLLLGCETTTTTDDNAAEGVGDATVEATTTSDAAVETADVTSEDVVSDEEIDQTLAVLGFESLEEAEDAEVPELNVETLEVKAPARTYQVEGYENTFVGEVTNELFIGISLDSRYTGQTQEIGVYICNSQGIATYLSGELDNGSATLSDETVEIELAVAENEISGTVTLAGDEGEPFLAAPATGNAGMYVVADSIDQADVWGRWIVLNDSRQRGSLCIGIKYKDVCIGIHKS